MERWPLSAASTMVLWDPKTAGAQVLKLSLKELVLREAWRLEQLPVGRLTAKRDGLTLMRAAGFDAPLPAPVDLLDARLRAIAGAGSIAVLKAVRELRSRHGDIGRALRDRAREELARDGLVTLEDAPVLRVIPRVRVTVTVAGASRRDASLELSDALRAASMGSGDPRDALEAAGAIVLLVDPGRLRELEDASFDTGGSGVHGFGDGALDLGWLDAFDGGFDSAVDAGGGGDGGDGGGGGDGGS